MRAKDLRKYKTLDITELSGSPWNDAEKVLGLDQDDKVIMAEPEETVTPEYVDEAIDQAMEAETARTEDTYAKKSEVPDLDDYYTKEEVDEAISGITVDLSDYYTKDETNQAISSATQDLASTDYVDDAIAAIPEPDLSDYYTKGETDGAISTALVPYATKGWVSSQSYANQNYVMFKVNEAMQIETARTESTYAKPSDIPSLDGYATEEYVDDAIADIPQVDLSEYAKTTAVTEDIQTAMAAETARTESTYLKEHQSLDNYYNKGEVDAKFVSAATEVGNAIDAAVQGLASETYVDNAVAGLASEGYVDAAVTAATEGLASEEYVDNAVAGIDFPEDYATTGDVANAVEGLASESYVDDAITSATEHMVTTDDLQDYATEQYVDDAVNGLAQGIGMLGMVNDVSESNGTVTVQKTTMQEGQLVTGSTSFNIATPGDIQTAIASETARTESTYLKEHQSLDNYYTKSQVDAEITGATADLATTTYVSDAVSNLETAVVDEFEAETARTESTYAKLSQIPSLTGYATEQWVQNQGYLTQHQDLSAYAKTTAVTEDIASAMAAETARTENTYAKPSQIPSLTGYATETYVDNAITAATEGLATEDWVEEKFTGTTIETPIVVSNTDSNVTAYIYTPNYSSGGLVTFKTTNVSNLVGIRLSDSYNTTDQPDGIMAVVFYNVYPFEVNSTITATSETYLELVQQESWSKYYYIIPSALDGTYDYTLLYNTDNNSVGIFKSPKLPDIVTGATATMEDLPVAQDSSNTKYYVYNDTSNTSKRVISNVGLLPNYSNGRLSLSYNVWGDPVQKGYDVLLPIGTNVYPGAKSPFDSEVLSKANEALDGFEETVTLTVGSQSETTFVVGMMDDTWDTRKTWAFNETNNPRYDVFCFSGITAGTYVQNYKCGQSIKVDGTTYRSFAGGGPLVLGTKLIYTTDDYAQGLIYNVGDFVGQNYYFILDKELLTAVFTDSLTFTMTKNIKDAFDNIPTPDMSNYWTSAQTQSAITAATQNLVTSGDVATQIGTAMASETARTESTYAKPSQIPSLNGYATEAWVGQQGYLTSQSLTNYYTKTEIDGMIGDIESLLASI